MQSKEQTGIRSDLIFFLQVSNPLPPLEKNRARPTAGALNYTNAPTVLNFSWWGSLSERA